MKRRPFAPALTAVAWLTRALAAHTPRPSAFRLPGGGAITPALRPASIPVIIAALLALAGLFTLLAWPASAQDDANAPRNLTAQIVDDGAALSWDAPAENADACDVTGAICTEDGKKLSSAVSHTVPGPEPSPGPLTSFTLVDASDQSVRATRTDGATVEPDDPATGNAAQNQSRDYDTDDDGLIEVSDLAQLNAIRWDVDGDGASSDAGYATGFPTAVAGMGCPDTGCIGYELAADLDFDTNGNDKADEADTYWNEGAGWLPIGSRSNPFAATFDGNGHTITSLYINRGSSSGLFAFTHESGIIKNTGLLSVAVVGSGYGSGGGLVGASKGRIENSSSEGTVGGCFDHIGGLVGANEGTIVDSHSAGEVISLGATSGDLLLELLDDLTGGFLSIPTGSRTCFTDGGGLVGRNRGSVTDSHSTSDVSGHSDNFGGLVGANRGGAIAGSYATGAVSGNGHADVGGLVGDNDAGAILASYATGAVSGRGDDFGGLVGANRGGTIAATFSTGSVSGRGYADLGGLVGDNSGAVTASYATGAVADQGDRQGGLVARNSADGYVSGSYWDTQTSGRAAGDADADIGDGKTTAELQTPTGYTGIYADWNVDLDGDGARDNPWDFRTTSEYPVLNKVVLTVAAAESLTPPSFAPADAPAFNEAVVGNRLNAETFYVDFATNGRFTESGRHQGDYSYANTGPNAGTLTLDYDSAVFGGGSCTVYLTFGSDTSGTWRYTCAAGQSANGSWTLTMPGLDFAEGDATTRTIVENTPAGVNVGRPVSATGSIDVLTYSISGADADSFAIISETGQIRTKSGVSYDYETKNRYTVTVRVADQSGGSDTVRVTILIGNLESACETLANVRANSSDQRLTVRWDPSERVFGKANVLGYQTELRTGDSGSWTDRRTLLGRSIGATIYGDLDNDTEYQVRVRAITQEGDCAWSDAVSVNPTAGLAPDDEEDPTDRFDRHPLGPPDHNVRFLTHNRCRHTGGGVTADADCRYENTDTDTGRIFLEFDDPSQEPCEITLAFSSLTAGSFVDECFDAGVNTNVPFDRSFQMPPAATSTASDLAPDTADAEPQRAPRDQDEFNALVFGRDDLIPGLCFGSCILGDLPEVGVARMFEFYEHGVEGEHYGEYTYEKTGSSEGKLTFNGRGGRIYVFDLEFHPSGNVSATVTDEDGNSTHWPGMIHTTLELEAEPILLPIPPSWSAAIAFQTDAAPSDYLQFGDLLQKLNPDYDRAYDPDIIWQTLFGEDLIKAVGEVAGYGNSTGYEKIGRNRARVTITFDDSLDVDDVYDDRSWSSTDRLFVDSEWVFDLTFGPNDTVTFTATRLKDGEPPVTLSSGTIDLRGGSSNLDEFPAETILPDTPPQASGSDRSGVEIAPAIGARRIGGDDLQTFLVNNTGLQAVSYSPGDWLEPKDGSHQRMMIVGVTPAASTASASSGGTENTLPVIVGGRTVSEIPVSWTFDSLERSCIPRRFYASAGSLTQLDVVCMQRLAPEIPPRGARYFSQPKSPEGPVQLCQRDCALDETENVQQCVWMCEAGAVDNTAAQLAEPGADPAERPATTAPATTLASPTGAKFIRDGSAAVVSWDAVAGADHYRIYYDDFFSSGCRLDRRGNPRFCEPLADNVTGTTYTHATPHPQRNYYWVAACDSDGCSQIDGDNPAQYTDTRPGSPTNVQYVWDSGTTVVSWDAVDGADYYRIYYDDFFGSSCRLTSSGRASFCELLADNVTSATYTHPSPDADDNYYWVVACASGGCSDIDSDNPAEYIDTKPAAPTNVQYMRGDDTIVVSWDAVEGADYYRIYYDDFFSSNCRLTRSESPSFCELLADNVTETTYTHTDPDDDDNYYWVVACNSGGCSEIDSDNPAPMAGAATGPDLTVDTPTVSDGNPAAGASFTLSVTVRNRGNSASAATTLRYYRSTDATITSDDTSEGTDTVEVLDADATSDHSVSLTAPDSDGTYYYGACLDTVSDETNTGNNCSAAVVLSVGAASEPAASVAGDYDADDDGLIEVSNLAQLNAIRWDSDGDGTILRRDDRPGYSSAFPGALDDMGCPDDGCAGYELVADLDFDTNGNGEADSGDTYWNDGAGWEPMELGSAFDGGGHTISNLYINRSDEDDVGLFGSPFQARIREVGLISADVTGRNEVGGLVGDGHGIQITDSYVTGTISGERSVGGLVGDSFSGRIAGSYSTAGASGARAIGGLIGDSSSDTIQDSYATGSVAGAGDEVGGLVGHSFGGAITASYATGSVSGDGSVGGLIGDSSSDTVSASFATGSATGAEDEVGGLVGDSFSGTITASYATGGVSGDDSVGGLIGDSSSDTISASFATGSVSGDGDDVGGLIGDQLGTTVSVSYWDTQTTGQSSSDGGEGKTTAELQSPTAYTGIFATWDMDLDADGSNDDPWDFGTSSQYPVLQYSGLTPVHQRR